MWGLATAIAQAGLHIKQFYYTSYTQDSITNAGADSALQGTFTEGAPTTGSSPTVKATDAEIAALKKYDSSYPGGIPDLGATIGWLGADTMIDGLEGGRAQSHSGFVHIEASIDDRVHNGRDVTDSVSIQLPHRASFRRPSASLSSR